jgi:hypothetical protein
MVELKWCSVTDPKYFEISIADARLEGVFQAPRYLAALRDSPALRHRHAIVVINERFVRITQVNKVMYVEYATPPTKADNSLMLPPSLPLNISQFDAHPTFWSSDAFGLSLDRSDDMYVFVNTCLGSIRAALKDETSSVPAQSEASALTYNWSPTTTKQSQKALLICSKERQHAKILGTNRRPPRNGLALVLMHYLILFPQMMITMVEVEVAAVAVVGVPKVTLGYRR